MGRFDLDFLISDEKSDFNNCGYRDTCPQGCCYGDCYFENVYKTVTKKAPENVKPIYRQIIQALKNGKNIFLTAQGGAGKSFLLRAIRENIDTLAVSASTGVAALGVGGVTLHSLLGIGLANVSVQRAVSRLKPYQAQRINNLKFLAIDEVSMISGKLLNYCNEYLKLVRCDKRPFGGIQVILIGDFCQLPPVTPDQDYYDFCFNSSAWRELELLTFELTHNFRQSEDEQYAKLLQELRLGYLSPESDALLTGRNIQGSIPEDVPILLPTNAEVQEINNRKLMELPSEKFTFTAHFKSSKYSDRPDVFNAIKANFIKSTIVDEEITLCEGARVMLLRNLDLDLGLANGTLGYIKEIDHSHVVMATDDGYEFNVPNSEVDYHDSQGNVIMTMTQYPLKVAYSTSIHKAQGVTLDKVYIDFARFFEINQGYVALSRVKKLSGLYCKNYNSSVFTFSPAVLNFYNSLRIKPLN